MKLSSFNFHGSQMIYLGNASRMSQVEEYTAAQTGQTATLLSALGKHTRRARPMERAGRRDHSGIIRLKHWSVRMKSCTSARLLLAWVFAFLYPSMSCLVAQPLSGAWWQQESAENILKKAESITHNLAYFRGSKAHLLVEPDASVEFYQRKTPKGTIETKSVFHQGRIQFSDYKLQSASYMSEFGWIIKYTFEDDQKERSLAATLGHPYDYKMLKSEMVGTNDCLIVARVATPQLLDMLTTNYYPGYTQVNTGALGDIVQFIGSETDTYVRKNDGIIIGELKRNKTGNVLSDRLYDVVQINVPIPDAEFILPKGQMEIATNSLQLGQLTSKALHAYNLPNQRDVKRIRFVIMGVMVLSSAVLLVLLYFRFHRGTIASCASSKR
jgi:hypothetical protein